MSELTVEEWQFPNDTPTRSMTTEQLLQGMATTKPDSEPKKRWPFLYVRDYRREEMSAEELSQGFSNHRQLGCFRIDSDLRCVTNCKPNWIKEETDLYQIAKLNLNLMDGYEKSFLINDYKTYRDKKWQFFLKWIQERQCLEDTSGQTVPHFVAFAGLFTSVMSTANKLEPWTLSVAKHKNCVFMNKVRYEDSANYQKSRQFKETDRNSYLSAKMTQILTTNESQLRVLESVNEFDKYFSIYEQQIGSHRLLLLSELDAEDEEGNQYSIKCSKDLKVGRKWFNWWSSCAVSDIDYLVVGLKDSNEVLTHVKRFSTQDIHDLVSQEFQNLDLAFDFVERLLDFIKKLMADAKDREVFRVSFRKNDTIIKSRKQWSNDSIEELLPNWFTGVDDESNSDEHPMEDSLS